jgi:hypothetical protein
MIPLSGRVSGRASAKLVSTVMVAMELFVDGGSGLRVFLKM